MKHLIVLILIILLFTSCDTPNEGITPEALSTDSEKSIEASNHENISLDITTRSNNPFLPFDPPEDLGEYPSHNTAHGYYSTFEQLCSRATDVVIATFSRRTLQNQIYQYRFEVTDSIRGLGTEDYITINDMPVVCTMDNGIEYTTYDCPFLSGHSYVLLLIRRKELDSTQNYYSFVNTSLVMPLNGYGNLLRDSTLYGQKLEGHIVTESILTAFQTGNSYREKLQELVKDNPFYTGQSYEGSTDMESVIRNADYVFDVTVDSIDMKTYDGSKITYNCTLNQQYKGETDHTQIEVRFPHNQDIIGQSFIVAVASVGGDLFMMSSPNSVFEISERDAILAVIEAEEE